MPQNNYKYFLCSLYYFQHIVVMIFITADYTLNDNSKEDNIEMDNSNSRLKRQTETYEYTPTKTRCPLLLVADYRFYQEMGASSTKTTINYLVRISFIANAAIVH